MTAIQGFKTTVVSSEVEINLESQQLSGLAI